MKDMLKGEVGERLRKLRKRLGLTQARMAALVNIKTMALNRQERGLNYPSAVTLHQMAAQFDVSLDWLLCNRGSMFRGKTESQKNKSSDMFEREVEELIYLMKHIPLVRHSVMGYFQKFKIDNQAFIDQELEKLKGNS
jgi:transcriptional regulator with XRE-family HTH domain